MLCCLLRIVVAGLAVVSPTLGAAESINPVRDEFQLHVSSITLEGFSALESYPIDLGEIRAKLDEERARFGDSVTVDELHQIADAVTLFVRGRGFPFHTIYLPPQQVVDGHVSFTLQESILADVHVINNTSIPSERFTRPFAALRGKLLYGPAVEQKVYALKNQTGVTVFAFYSRATRPGETRLNLRVENTAKRSLSLRFDNFGSDSSGRQRIIGHYTEHQLTRHFDRLSMAVLQTVDGVSNTYGSLSYERPFQELDYVFDAAVSNNQFEVGDAFAALELEGQVASLRAGVTQVFDHKPGQRHSARLGGYRKSSDLVSGFDDALAEDEASWALTVLWNREFQLGPTSGLAASLGLSRGRYDSTRQAGSVANTSFNKLDFSTAWAQSSRSTGRWANRRQLSWRGQYSGENLPSIESMALTGAYGVRAYEPGQYAADRGWVISAEWSFPRLIASDKRRRWGAEPFVFADAAMGEKLASTGERVSKAQFLGVGAGFRFAVSERVSGQMIVASPIAGEINEVEGDSDEVWLFEIRWR